MRAARFNPAPLTLAAAIAATFAAGITPAAHAQTGVATPGATALSIPAQSLAQALNELARQANLQMSFPAALVAGKTAPAVSGRLTATQALERLLAGSGLEATVDGSAVLVRQAPTGQTSAPSLPVVQVTDSATRLPDAYPGGQVAYGGRIGLLGDKDMLDTPFNSTQYTSQLIDDQQAQNLGDVLLNDPTVRNTYSRGSGRDEFNIRGFTLFNYDVSFNGLYGLSPRNSSSMIGIERVEVLRGPNALLNGMAPAGSVGGAINLVPKRAGAENLNRLALSYIDDGQFGTQFDVARRFGANRELGVRANALYRSGDTPIDHSSESVDAFALGVDYQGDRVRLEADLTYQNRLTYARSGLLFPPEAGIPIGPAPDAKTNFLPEWTYWKTKELSGMVRAEVDVAPGVTAWGAIGAQQYDFRSLQTSWLMLDTQGEIAGRPARLNEDIETRTAEAGLRGKFETGPLHHEPVMSVSTYASEQGTRRQNGDIIFSSLYAPVDIPEPSIAIAAGTPKVADTRLRSLALADTIFSSDRRIQVTLGARNQQVETSGFNPVSGAQIAHYDESAVTPMAAMVFKATDALSVYGNYIEGLSQGPVAPDGAANAGQVFPPIKTRQLELGTKYDFGTFAATFSVFQIERPSSFLDPLSLLFRADGEQRNRGAELITQGELARGVRLLAGAAYTDGTLLKTEGGVNDGRTAPATPKFQLNVAGEWDTPFLPGFTLTARALRTSGQYVDVGNTQQLPGWTRYDIGARYRFMTGNIPVTIRGAIENVLDKSYWQSAAREGLTVGAPRTFLLSVSADF
ncbi:TonB-dependent receptor [Variovorax sp.]|uniref:TonB-dependent receptor n=1 Tax=Variovorax sp. TaxID=1871043 RepID=UPI002D73EBD2|nr:TonB-dependent receptor [Variovorax sp.]HYP82788.1 TonB-dependent receptor [Variovorax sp.]